MRGGKIGMIFQEPMTSLNPVLSIGRQMTEALEIHRGLDRLAARRRAVEMLERVGISDPERRLRQYPHEFSGGMRQRVMIAATMALEPRLLIADEPTTALDVTIQAQILDLMRKVTRETGTSMLLITHDMGVVAEMADRVVVMRYGRVVETQKVAALFEKPDQDYTRKLLAAVPRLDGPTADMPTRGPASAALVLTNVSKSFDRHSWFRRPPQLMLFADVSLSIARGETLALVGESGSGKSTLGRIAARLIDGDAGRIEVSGQDLTGLEGQRLRRARRGIQMIFQDPFASLDPRFTVARTLAEPMSIAGCANRAENPPERSSSCSTVFACRHRQPSGYRTSSPVGSGSGSRWQGPWLPIHRWSWPTSPHPHLTSQSRRKSSTCLLTSNENVGSPSYSSRMTLQS